RAAPQRTGVDDHTDEAKVPLAQQQLADPAPAPPSGPAPTPPSGAAPTPPSGAPPASPNVGPTPPTRRRIPPRFGRDFVLTRLHARYGRDLKDDLVFRAAPPIAGGREHIRDGGKLEEGAQPASINNFQGRYAIRHPWTGPITCSDPRRGIWGGPPDGGRPTPQAALNLAFAPRGAIQLPASIEGDVP